MWLEQTDSGHIWTVGAFVHFTGQWAQTPAVLSKRVRVHLGQWLCGAALRSVAAPCTGGFTAPVCHDHGHDISPSPGRTDPMYVITATKR